MYSPTKDSVIDTTYCLFRWFLFLLLISISTASMPCTMVNSLGLFGEVKASVIICEEEEEAEAVEAAVKRCKCGYRSIRQKSLQARLPGSWLAGINVPDIFNIWFVLSVVVLYFCYIQYRLPGKTTIVTLKVRMDN